MNNSDSQNSPRPPKNDFLHSRFFMAIGGLLAVMCIVLIVLLILNGGDHSSLDMPEDSTYIDTTMATSVTEEESEEPAEMLPAAPAASRPAAASSDSNMAEQPAADEQSADDAADNIKDQLKQGQEQSGPMTTAGKPDKEKKETSPASVPTSPSNP